MVRARVLLVIVLLAVTRPATADTGDGENKITSILRLGMVVEFLVPDTSVEFALRSDAIGATLSWPVVVRLTSRDFGAVTSRKHWFVLTVLEPQLAFGRKRDPHWRGLASVRLGSGLYNEGLSVFGETGYHVSQQSIESGAVLGIGVGYLPHHLVDLGLLARYYAGDEQRIGFSIDVSIPLRW